MRATVGFVTLVLKPCNVFINRVQVISALGLLGGWPVRPFR